MNSLPTIPLFPAGQIVATPGALALLEQANRSPFESFRAIYAVIGAISARTTRLKTN